MLSIEDRFVGAYRCALSGALNRGRTKIEIDMEVAVMFDWFKSCTQDGAMKKRRKGVLIDLPILLSLRFQRDPTLCIRSVRHLFLDCSKQNKRDEHDRVILQTAYLSWLLEGCDPDKARGNVLRQYDTGFLFTSDVGSLVRDGIVPPIAGEDEVEDLSLPLRTRMFQMACYGAHFGFVAPLQSWQEELIDNRERVKGFGSTLFRAAYGYSE